MRVWITRYALTQGLFQVDAELVTAHGVTYASCRRSGIGLFTREWAKTEAEAVKAFEKMRSNKIKSLRRQLERLEQMPVLFRKGQS